MLSECRAIAERMNCECHSHLNFWAVLNSGSDQISPPRSLAFVCECHRTSANGERKLNYYWANRYESGVIWQVCKRFRFANGYSLKWDQPFILEYVLFTVYHVRCNNSLICRYYGIEPAKLDISLFYSNGFCH